jgi:hypothetical protein
MKRILVVSLIALLAPVMVFAANPAASAGAKSGATVMGGVSSGTVAVGALAVAVVGAAVLSSGGDGSSSASGVNDLPTDLQASIKSLTGSLTADQKASFDYILAEAGSVEEVSSVLTALEAALNTPGVTQADIDAVFSSVANAKDKSSALGALSNALSALRASDPALFGVVNEFVQSLTDDQLTKFAKVVSDIQATGSSFAAVAKAIIEENGGSVAQVTPTHTPSKHFTTPTHQY